MSNKIHTYLKFLSKNSLIISVLLLFLVFLLFYPKTYVSIDEHNYLYNGQNLLKGTLKQQCIPDETSQFYLGDYCIYKYNIGTSFFFILSWIVHPTSAFFITFLTYVYGIFIFKYLLQEFKIDPIFLFFFAWYPTFIYFSRTLFSEIFSMVFIISTVYFAVKFQKNNNSLFGLLSGIFGGLSILIRYSNIFLITILYFFLFLISLKKKRQTDWLVVISGIIPFLAFFFIFNFSYYGHPLRSGYFYSKEEGVFDLSVFPIQYLYFCLVLTILYPFMLPISLQTKIKFKTIILFMIFFQIIFYALFPNNIGAFEGRILDLILGGRFLMPILPMVLFLYFKFLNQFLNKNLLKIIIFLGILVLCVNLFLLSKMHQEFLSTFPLIDY
jgi:hypothetical protein